MAIVLNVTMAQTVDDYFSLAVQKHYNGEYQKAVVFYTRAIELDSTNTNSFYLRGVAKSMLKDYRGAVEDNSIALEIDSKFAEAYFVRGVSFLALGEKESGCKDLSKAGELGHPDAYSVIQEFCN